MKSIRVLPEVEQEIDEALRWFSEIDAGLAEAFKLDLDHALQKSCGSRWLGRLT